MTPTNNQFLRALLDLCDKECVTLSISPFAGSAMIDFEYEDNAAHGNQLRFECETGQVSLHFTGPHFEALGWQRDATRFQHVATVATVADLRAIVGGWLEMCRAADAND